LPQTFLAELKNMARKKPKGTELSVFKGREAKLNRALIQIMPIRGHQTIYEIHKSIKNKTGLRKTKYATVNKRVRTLERMSFFRKSGSRKTKAGFQSATYEVQNKVYVAMLLASVGIDSFVEHLNDIISLEIVASILSEANQTSFLGESFNQTSPTL
jgi:hypothetical protein